MTTNACGLWTADGCDGTPYCPPRCPQFVDRDGDAYLILPLEDEGVDVLVSMYRTFDPGSRAMGLPPLAESAIRDWLERSHDRGTNLVAWTRDRDRIAGHVGYVPDGDPAPELLVYVHQEFHGRGLGTELVTHAIAHAAATGRERLVLYVDGRNKPAVAVYRKLGFEVVDRHAGELEMHLPLSSPIADDAQLAPAARA
ncbi:GNAT family N-acetyltransferase [Natrononativus amylolyticus]|uniref:GNAT family N-acetyltransferase n=1 Tax=Natrononativus amylolyticus TaxID=2963434 RepID=UPI0020CE26BE|nr:GNAT family N-acetyltransferase [Natrononativus amylolyticus]